LTNPQTAQEFIENTRNRWAKAIASITGAVIITVITGVLGRSGVH